MYRAVATTRWAINVYWYACDFVFGVCIAVCIYFFSHCISATLTWLLLRKDLKCCSFVPAYSPFWLLWPIVHLQHKNHFYSAPLQCVVRQPFLPYRPPTMCTLCRSSDNFLFSHTPHLAALLPSLRSRCTSPCTAMYRATSSPKTTDVHCSEVLHIECYTMTLFSTPTGSAPYIES
jgi:hypothetical protein